MDRRISVMVANRFWQCCFVLLLFPIFVSAQKREGETAFANRQWAEALDFLNQYQAQKPGDLAVLSKIGICHYRLHQPERARQVLDYVTHQPRVAEAETYYYYARTLHGLMEWENAIAAYKQFLRQAPADHPLRANVRDNLRRCVSGMQVTTNDAVAIVENFGPVINSAGAEFAPLPSLNFSNRIYFSAARAGTVGGQRDELGYEDKATGNWCSDMFIADRTTRGWDAPRPFSSLQNTSRYESALDFTNNGRVLYFFRGFTLYSGEIFTDTSGLNDEYATSPHPWASPVHPEEGDIMPFFYNDTTLFFASRRTGGQGGLDLYAATRNRAGEWSAARSLGAAINSPYDETTPFMAKDGQTLYFSSNRTESIGGLDVYKSVFDIEKGEWPAPESAGLPINSPGDDAWFRLAADGRTATFASDRLLDNLGQFDLYTAYFKEEQGEQLAPNLPCAFFTPKKAAPTGNANGQIEVALEPLFYNNDRDVVRPDNLKIVEQAAALARNFPSIQLIITAHTDENGPAKFDLYSGIKRAEMIGKALTERGIAADHILLRSAGAGFPLARNVQNGTPSTVGQQFNRRLEISATGPAGAELPNLLVTHPRPIVVDIMAAAGTSRLDEQNQGLLYRVEMTTTGQILTADALGLFSDLLIESVPATGQYHYLTGAGRQFSTMTALKKEVVAQGFNDARIVAYINGAPVTPAEAIGLLKKYPDLAAFIRG